MTPEQINLAREWLATISPVAAGGMPAEMQGIVDTIEEALEIAMEATLSIPNGER